jgi:hypothetical protein
VGHATAGGERRSDRYRGNNAVHGCFLLLQIFLQPDAMSPRRL